MASGGDDKTVRLWSLSGQPVHFPLTGHGNRITTVIFSPDGQRLYSGGWKDSVRTWDVKKGLVLSTLGTNTADLTGMGLSPDGRFLGLAFGAVVEIWDVQRGGQVTTLKGHAALVRSVAFSPDGRRLATSAEDHTVRLWEPASGQTVFAFPSLLSVINKIRFSPNGNKLLSASPQGLVYLWDATAVSSEFSQPPPSSEGRDRAEDMP
jgi:WD40 repeat protein